MTRFLFDPADLPSLRARHAAAERRWERLTERERRLLTCARRQQAMGADELAAKILDLAQALGPAIEKAADECDALSNAIAEAERIRDEAEAERETEHCLRDPSWARLPGAMR